MSLRQKIGKKAAEYRKKLREKGNERITFLVIPHNDRAIVNMQLSNYVIALAIFSLIFIIVASFFAVSFQRNIQSEADSLQDRDRAYVNERELYLRKYHEMVVQQDFFKKQFGKIIVQAKLHEGEAPVFLDNDMLHESAVQMLDAEGEEFARSLSYKENRTVKFLNFETTLKVAQGKSQEEGFYFYPEIALYRQLKLDLKQTGSAVAMLQQLLKERDIVQQALPYYWPLAGGHFTSFFGGRISPFGHSKDFHTGVDLANATGTPIYAAADGKVTSCGYSGGYGLSVRIAHSFGFQTLYGHMSSIHTSCGSYVRKGQQIGRVGATGRATGPHLHYEVRIMEHPVNPMPYLTSG
ncbi:MAG: M23 family metallopeptidase [Spirochaetes bacterium]|nr:M23 family metallopeptidase [Spirochaetota bacterium]MBX3722160.1 M23 family metallopeptidase [Turneriella sp.]